ncbi:hypothetical protein YPPY94_2476 [Yersinia pestis PY-94]|nr:hypothetical protein YPPY05_2429 [Yersinia pestis PY-05]EIR33740.1 hypothetical protein YPPY11_2571 [Yersinia pestis PY-11]EIS06202.1 hypothetical protein YPPY48_2494 [Yersinia pestis PY-48]EIS18116.1 hypothetical protein YPPY52_2504 [Yersinia pestis PY-52]EIS43635.1 hypothetical protein YPPY60_2469 [Yersinia pestis PY-60]EIT16577.1 hypothetical protein YPPY94_2476 [Yersinia pestis PY-94]EIT30228.1 hypothetical protein YPPY96_2389 [Yersinia pestis PY-96]EIT45798.1 hypothetical protein YPP
MHPIEVLQLLWSHFESDTLPIFVFDFVKMIKTPEPVL